jgi:putative endonuclease
MAPRSRDPQILAELFGLAKLGPAYAAIRYSRMELRFFVYILASKRNGTLYVGVTNNLARRMSEHKAKFVPGFTRQYGVDLLVYFEAFDSILEARAREHSLKRWRRAWKIDLIEKLNPDWRDLTDQLNS